MLECVVNVSEGRDEVVLGHLSEACSGSLLDVHFDGFHNRSVFTLCGVGVEEDARRLSLAAAQLLDIRFHHGLHPRLGVVDVVPFVPLFGAAMEEAVAARDRYAAWFGRELNAPAFLYGPEISLPEVRRTAFAGLSPTFGPERPHPRLGAVCVGARPLMVALNFIVAGDLETAKSVSRRLRSSAVRTLTFDLGGRYQVSMNLIEPVTVGPVEIYEAASVLVEIEEVELVGLVPAAALADRSALILARMGIDQTRTIEYRVDAAKD